MPILIQELIASDSISQAVDKINFNFDQILLNGGGPVGPPGPTGPPGPIGGRGLRGSQWYEDSLPYPGRVPSLDTNIVVADLLPEDNYLQSNGDVWTWSGLTWTLTEVNLTGPVGPAGSSGSWLKFGADVANPSGATGFRAIYPEPFNLVNGANSTNEGVSTVVVGGIVTQTPPITGITQTLSIIPNDIAKNLNSEITSMFVHQKTSSGKGIMFHGGPGGEYFEQADIANLVYMGLDADDAFKLVVPKMSTDANTNLVGLTIQTERTSQWYRAGKEINFSTGNDQDPTIPGGTLSSNFVVNARQIPSLGYPEINFNSLDSSAGNQARIQVGGNGSYVGPTPSTTNNGNIVLDAGYTFIYGRNRVLTQGGQIDAISAAGISMTAVSGITLSSPLGGISLIGNTNVTGTMYISLSAVVNGDLQTNSNFQVGGNSNLIGTLTVGGITTLNDHLILNSVPAATPATTNEVLVRDTTNNTVSSLTNGTIMPIGGIIMWNGGATTVPTGWRLCDGATYTLPSGSTIQTPDLRSRFIIGAGSNANLNNSRVKRINYNKFNMQFADDFQGTFDTARMTGYSHTPYYAFKATGAASSVMHFPTLQSTSAITLLSNQIFGRWDGYSENPVTGCNNNPRYYYWVDMDNNGPNYTEKIYRGIAMSGVDNYDYDSENPGYLTASGTFMPFFQASETVIDGQRKIAPYAYVNSDRTFAWLFHLPSREYRLYWMGPIGSEGSTVTHPIPRGNATGPIGSWSHPIVYYSMVLLTRSIGTHTTGSDDKNFPYGQIGTSFANDNLAGSRSRDPRVGPAWGTWSWWDKYFVNGIRIDLPSKYLGMIEWSYETFDTYQVGEVGGSIRHSLSRTQMPQHMHGGLGESLKSTAGTSAGNWPNSLFGVIGGINQNNIGSEGGIDSDNGMYNSASAGGGGEYESLPPYYALSYIMYVGV